MTDTHEARVEAAAEAIYDLKPERTAIMGPLGWTDPEFDQWVDRGGYRQKARAALSAADAVVTVEEIRDEIAGHPIGSGYYQTTVGVDEAHEIAEIVQRLYRGEHDND